MEKPTPDATALARLLEIRVVEVISGRGCSLTLSSVRCPVRRRSEAVEECACCGRGGGIAHDALARGEFLACSGVPQTPRAGGAAARAVTEAMGPDAVALRPGVERTVAADALRARGVPSAPVVDGEGRPIGAVSEADLLRAPPGTRVADAMTRIALAIPESTPVGRAAYLMAEHGVERLPVVGAEGVVVGVLSAADVLAWLTRVGDPPARE